MRCARVRHAPLWAIAALALVLAACTPAAPPTSTSPTTDTVQVMTNQQKAEQTYQALTTHFHVSESGLYREHYAPKPDDRAVSFLWPYSGLVSAVNALAAMPGGEAYHDDLARILGGLEHYWDADGAPPGYDSYIRSAGGGQKYYDDNAWLALDFVEAYRTLDDRQYLDKAILTFQFVISGWSDDLGGGIYWRENDPETKNTCSNGPTAVLALMLYQETGDEQYLTWARQILDWTAQLKSPDSGVYWDHLKRDGSIDKRTYTYNTGTIIHANALLYQISGEERYLQEAQALAAASREHFVKDDPVADIAIYPDTPWFNVILFRGYLALYEADPARDRTYIDAMRANVEYAWANARTTENLFSPDWTGRSGMTNPHKWLLDQAPMIEFYARLAQFDTVEGVRSQESGVRRRSELSQGDFTQHKRQ
jgi:hypothetical protein